MTKLEKIQIKELFTTIVRLADDCLYELEREEYDDNQDEIDTLLEVKVGRISDEINLFEEMIMRN